MFGYILPERAHLYMKDFDLYRNFYCGICKAMGKLFGQSARFTINYDITFLAILIHNYLGVDVKYEKLKCVTKPMTKRQMVSQNELTDKLAAANVILTYYKVVDDVIDTGRLSRKAIVKSMKRAKSKADKMLPFASEIVEKRYEALRKLENEGCDSVDKVSHEFAMMMQELAENLTIDKKNDKFSKLCYNVGKWIYLIDALDDFDKDIEKKAYNPFISTYTEIKSRSELVEKFANDIAFTFSSIMNRIIECYNDIKFSFNTDFIFNVIYKGLPLMTKGVMQGEQCKTTYSKF